MIKMYYPPIEGESGSYKMKWAGPYVVKSKRYAKVVANVRDEVRYDVYLKSTSRRETDKNLCTFPGSRVAHYKAERVEEGERLGDDKGEGSTENRRMDGAGRIETIVQERCRGLNHVSYLVKWVEGGETTFKWMTKAEVSNLAADVIKWWMRMKELRKIEM